MLLRFQTVSIDHHNVRFQISHQDFHPSVFRARMERERGRGNTSWLCQNGWTFGCDMYPAVDEIRKKLWLRGADQSRDTEIITVDVGLWSSLVEAIEEFNHIFSTGENTELEDEFWSRTT